ncbi:MAG: DNA-3-methyladenine glycosylase I [Rhizobiales bacterium TMED94]|nr:DNA-3-methyladenine glycosylase I [Rhodobiaceae bacterium]RPF87862.1 MAG: DNA-3-methyladenine glycosylase I [Rhizobiales bacterium TMED94]|tara:strand:+ start:2964 stop:3542 length:579 start_codon:yes stop_codon:yes gene_type:complete
MKKRCLWPGNDDLYIRYHDEEWGVPVHDDRVLFEALCLEGQQAGLSWITVLKKRDNYRKAFYNFNIKKVSLMSDDDIFALLSNDGLIKNKLKLFSIRNNAISFQNIQKSFGSFDNYIWSYAKDKIIKSKDKNALNLSSKLLLSNNISKDLKKRGFKFIGPKICYAYLQAIGIINDHENDCFRYNEIKRLYND